jgi:peptidoglycan/xylan/chitin deacetylase (PgdA/CDA1 family)
MILPTLHVNYHEITDGPAPYLYSLPAAALDEHLRVAAELERGGVARLGITFDDGHRTQFENALAVLDAHQVRAIFFVTAGWTGREADYMDWGQLRRLADAGHDIQSHGWEHRFFTTCTAAELDEELRRPREILEDHLGRPVDALSFPGGRWDERVLDACREAGYRRLYLSDSWPPERQIAGLTLYGRVCITRQMDGAVLMRLMRSGGRPAAAERVMRAVKNALRRALGERQYHRLWCLLAQRGESPERNAEDGNRRGLSRG